MKVGIVFEFYVDADCVFTMVDEQLWKYICEVDTQDVEEYTLEINDILYQNDSHIIKKVYGQAPVTEEINSEPVEILGFLPLIA